VSTNPGSFLPSELAGADSPMTDSDLAMSYATARELERAAGPDEVRPSAGFADRVMASIAGEPAPRRAGFLSPVLARHSLAGFIASVRAASSIALDGAGRPVGARGLALAYVLAVLLVGVSLTGAAAYGAAGAMGLLSPDRTARPAVIVPGPSEAPQASHEASEPSGTQEPHESLEPSELPEASETAEPGASDHAHESPAPARTASPRETDDHGATESPGASDDHGGDSGSPDGSDDSGSSGGSGSGSPTQSPGPTESPSSSD